MEEQQEQVNILKLQDNLQDSITLIKNTKGYNWEIKVYFQDYNIALDKINKINSLLKAEYDR